MFTPTVTRAFGRLGLDHGARARMLANLPVMLPDETPDEGA
jgi:hypothetical protein